MSPLTRTLLPVSTFLALISSAPGALIYYFDFENPGNLGESEGSHPGAAVVSAGVTSLAEGTSGSGATFSSGSSLQMPVSLAPGDFPQLTWGAWVRPSSSTPIQTILSHDNGGYDRSLVIDNRLGLSGTTTTSYGAYGGSSHGVHNSGVAVTPGEWTFVAAAYDQGNNLMRLHVGDQVFTLATSFTNDSGTTTLLGGNPSFGEYFVGDMDEVFIYDSFLSSAQVETLRLNGVPEPSSLGLVALGLLLANSRRRQS
ncbi:LamG domain-containing protein [Roseibacillus ishigakijimensis]|uniref:LamG domain-containing protein n=1 Tax=Roseibacillus ishigakijimensis TaxID=454146 RepID=A0A934VNH5_9BACT|nr:LamG domain-containing protein [Roseibacillus ishigakijimensis]MBK1835111.1 LamG domain-containing protein [Roseibacillus ishigakijimensis]